MKTQRLECGEGKKDSPADAISLVCQVLKSAARSKRPFTVEYSKDETVDESKIVIVFGDGSPRISAEELADNKASDATQNELPDPVVADVGQGDSPEASKTPRVKKAAAKE